jgi:iron complex transport system substrate-binding protein
VSTAIGSILDPFRIPWPWSIRGRALFFILSVGLYGCSPGSRGEPAEPEEHTGLVDSSASATHAEGPGDSVLPSFPITIWDAHGKPVTFNTPPERILSLVPSATEALSALGAGDLLVGRTQYDTTADLAHLPSVGGGLEPNLEAMILLRPDLVILFSGESDPTTPLRLDDLAITHFAVRLDSIADVLGFLETLGTITGKTLEASSLVAESNRTLAQVQDRVRGRPKPRAAYVLGGHPPWVAGPGTFLDELLSIAGGENVFSDLQALYGPVSLEEFLTREIDLLIAPMGAEVPLGQFGIPLHRVPASVEFPGPHLARSALELARILHPEVFR